MLRRVHAGLSVEAATANIGVMCCILSAGGRRRATVFLTHKNAEYVRVPLAFFLLFHSFFVLLGPERGEVASVSLQVRVARESSREKIP